MYILIDTHVSKSYWKKSRADTIGKQHLHSADCPNPEYAGIFAPAAQDKAMQIGLEIINLQQGNPGNPRIKALEKEQNELLALAANIPKISVEIQNLARKLVKTET